MEYCPQDLLNCIALSLRISDIAMLSLVNKFLATTVLRKFGILYACIYDGELAKVKMCEQWCHKWDRRCYWALGASGNIELLEHHCVRKYIIYNKINLNLSQVYEIYSGACTYGKLLTVKWLHDNYIKGDVSWETYQTEGIMIAAKYHHYEIMDFYDSNLSSIWDVSAEHLDLELAEYCVKRNVAVPFNWIYVVNKSSKTITEVRNYLYACKDIGVNFPDVFLSFDKYRLDIMLICVSLGSKYDNVVGRSSVSYFQYIFSKCNIGIIDWLNEKQKKLIFSVIGNILNIGRWSEVLCVKQFLKDEAKQNFSFTYDIMTEFYALYKEKKQLILENY